MLDADIENPQFLLDYLEKSGHLADRGGASVRVLSGGVSNRTVLVQFTDGRQWVLKQALSKLRVEVDWFSDPARIHREAQGLRLLSDLLPAGSVTRFLFEDPRHHILAMEAVPEPHENWKDVLLQGRADLELVGQFGRILAHIHRNARGRAGELAAGFADRSFFETLRLEPYYGFAARQVPEAASFLHQLIADTMSRQETIVHGDFSPKNILIYHNRLVLLDHEVIHLGDPAFDLGFSLAHFLSKAHHLNRKRKTLLQAALHYWHVYWEECNIRDDFSGLEPRAVRHTLGCLMARARGRSPLEYLEETAREKQARICVGLMVATPPTITEMVERFSAGLDRRE